MILFVPNAPYNVSESGEAIVDYFQRESVDSFHRETKHKGSIETEGFKDEVVRALGAFRPLLDFLGA